MKENSTTECLLFPEIFGKTAVMQFDQRQGSSDGGAILLKGAEKRYGLIGVFADSLMDNRQPGKVDHKLEELIGQRVFSLACGYADGNDAARLASDPIYKMLLDRDPVKGLDLASQATLSRFENAVGPKDLYLLGQALANKVIQRHRQRLGDRVRRVTIDLDPTDDPTHGAQQLSFFNGYYDNSCYLPMMGFVSFNDEPDQYLCAAVLRPGNVTAAAGALGILRRLIALIRSSFPTTSIRVRLDSGFAHPQLLQFLDTEPSVEYVVAMPSNQVLDREAEPALQQVRLLSEISEQSEHLYDETYYAAKSWPHKRRVLIKAEVVYNEGRQVKDNPRFVITNMKQSAEWLYERVYCQRGEIENRIKELHDLQIDRTSCSRFWANQFRVLLTAAAYVLLQELRLQAAGTDCDRAQVWTLRERFLKLGARVTSSVRRLVIHLPLSFPFLSTFRHLAVALGASPG